DTGKKLDPDPRVIARNGHAADQGGELAVLDRQPLEDAGTAGQGLPRTLDLADHLTRDLRPTRHFAPASSRRAPMVEDGDADRASARTHRVVTHRRSSALTRSASPSSAGELAP